jgi:hypothetical protein
VQVQRTEDDFRKVTDPSVFTNFGSNIEVSLSDRYRAVGEHLGGLGPTTAPAAALATETPFTTEAKQRAPAPKIAETDRI